MKKIETHKIPYPNTLQEASDVWNELCVYFGNGEELYFEIVFERDKEILNICRIALDELNEDISIFHFYWLDGSGREFAVDSFSNIHLDLKGAEIIADTLRYFCKIIKSGNNETKWLQGMPEPQDIAKQVLLPIYKNQRGSNLLSLKTERGWAYDLDPKFFITMFSQCSQLKNIYSHGKIFSLMNAD